MKKELVQKLHKSFEDCAHKRDGVEFWLLTDRAIVPEALPAAEDVKKFERRLGAGAAKPKGR